MLKKALSGTLIMIIVMVLFVGCQPKKVVSDETKQTEQGTEKQIKIGLVVGTGGLGDQNFNDMAFNGLKEAEAQYGIKFDYSEPQSSAEFESHISRFAQEGSYDLIIVSTNEAKTALEKIAEQYPDQKFSIVDAQVDKPNVKSILKDFSEMTFLNGYLAGLMATENSAQKNTKPVIGILLGMDIPNMRDGARGYTAGAKLANPDIDVRIGIVGAFNDPAKAKEITKSMYDDGAYIVLNFSGGSGLGMINQAKELNFYAMGGARNQNADAPDNIIASAIENLKDKITSEAKEISEGTWKSGAEIGSLKDAYVGITFEGSNVKVPQEMLDKVESLRKKVVDGKIVLLDDISNVDNWAKENQATVQQ